MSKRLGAARAHPHRGPEAGVARGEGVAKRPKAKGAKGGAASKLLTRLGLTLGQGRFRSLRDKEKLLAIDEALEKLREGAYGVCEECGDEIGEGRLKAMPLAKLCVPCQSRLEKETAHQKFAEERLLPSLIREEVIEETD